jgi:hypothetical protein
MGIQDKPINKHRFLLAKLRLLRLTANKWSMPMASGVFDSILLQHVWGTEELRGVFNDDNRVQKWFDYEAALAISQAELGIIPAAAATEIAAKARVANVDLAAIASEMHYLGVWTCRFQKLDSCVPAMQSAECATMFPRRGVITNLPGTRFKWPVLNAAVAEFCPKSIHCILHKPHIQ